MEQLDSNMRHENDIRQLLFRLQPRSLLCLGEHCRALLEEYLQLFPDTALTHLAAPEQWQHLGSLGQFDFSLISDSLETLDKTSATYILAGLRDLHGGRFALMIDMAAAPGQTTSLQHEELLALGLRLLSSHTSPGILHHLYYFDLYDYKLTPDWLSPRFWANPERWDTDYW